MNTFILFFLLSASLNITLLCAEEKAYATTEFEIAIFPEPIKLKNGKLISGPMTLDSNVLSQSVLISNGTEDTRLDSSEALNYPIRFDYSHSQVLPNNLMVNPVPIGSNFPLNESILKQWMSWKRGISVEGKFSLMEFYPDKDSAAGNHWQNTGYKYQEKITLSLGKKWLDGGGAIHLEHNFGDLTDSIKSINNSAFKNIGWTVFLRIPGISYEFSGNSDMLPEFAWLEKKTPTLARERQSSRNLVQYKKGNQSSTFKNNVSHKVVFKFGKFKYGIISDQDVYGDLIHHFQLEEIPAVFGSWGMDLAMTSLTVIPGISISLLPFDFSAKETFNIPVVMRITPVIIDAYFHNMENYLINVKWRAEINNIFNKPHGEKL